MKKIQTNPLTDRKSKFVGTLFHIKSEEDVKKSIKSLLKNKKFRKATHNIYAYRILNENNEIIENKNDDGETGAGIKLLEFLRNKNIVNIIIIVTRWYGGVHLGSDRFKHIIKLAKILVEKDSKKK